MARFGFLATTLAIKLPLPIWPSSLGRLLVPFWGCERLRALSRSACRKGSGCFQRNLLKQLDGWASKHSLDRAIFWLNTLVIHFGTGDLAQAAIAFRIKL